MFTGSTSVDSTNCRLKIFLKSNSRKFQKAILEYAVHQQLFLWHLHFIRYYKSSSYDLGHTGGYVRVIYKYYSFYIRDLSTLGFWYLPGVLEPTTYRCWKMTMICSFLSLFLLWGHIRENKENFHSAEKLSTAAELCLATRRSKFWNTKAPETRQLAMPQRDF